MQISRITYNKVKITTVYTLLFAFCLTSFAADCYKCVCKPTAEFKKEIKCCSKKTEKKCCGNQEKKCDSQDRNCGSHDKSKNCEKCSIKKCDIENPGAPNNNCEQKTGVPQVTSEIISNIHNTPGFSLYYSETPPVIQCKLYISFSNIRI